MLDVMHNSNVCIMFFSRKAKQEQLRLWKGYTPAATPDYAGKAKNFTGRVVEVGHADNIIVKTTDGALHKVFFSSLRPPRYIVLPLCSLKAISYSFQIACTCILKGISIVS